MPRVSVVLTCYNHLRHLKIAWDSIEAQTFRDFEVIALDDGSTDGTREWLSGLSPSFPLKLVFNERNLGTYGTLNKGIEAMEGEFFAEFNDDDVWMPSKLEKQVAVMDARPEIGLVHTSGYFIDDEGQELKENPLKFPWPKTSTGDVLLELVPHNKIIASSVLVRRECFEKVGVFNPTYFGSGDWEMWYRIAERYHVGHIDEPLTLYRVHAGSASHFNEKVFLDDLRIREWMAPRLAGYAGRFDASTLRSLTAHTLACCGTGRVWLGEARAGRRYYLRSLRAMPWRIKSALRYLMSFLPRRSFRALD
jgi:glycosyltransferase involved in cell wall biosynthesis